MHVLMLVQLLTENQHCAGLQAQLLRWKYTTSKIIHHTKGLLNCQSAFDHNLLPHKQIQATTNLGLAVFQMLQYLAPAAASGPSPKHMNNITSP